MRRRERIPLHDHSGFDAGGLVAQSTIVTLVNGSPSSGSSATAPVAADVPVADVADNFTAGNVEDVLAELAAAGGGGNDTTLSTVAASGTAQTLDVSAARTYDVTLTGNCTFTLTGAVTAEAWALTVMLRQDGTGSRLVTWPGSVAWPGGTAPVLSTAASAVDIFVLLTVNGGTTWFGFPTGGTGSSTVAALDDLTDVTITSPAEAQTLVYRSGAWVNEATPVGRWELVVADGGSGPTGVNVSEYVEMTTPDTTTSATLEDITGATTDITLIRTSHVAAWMAAHVSASADCTLGLALNFDGTDHDVVDTHLGTTSEGSVTVLHRTTTALAAGTYTIKGRMKRVSGGGTPSVDRVDLFVMAMGQSGPDILTTDAEDDFLYAEV
jgi:hypothetical protein